MDIKEIKELLELIQASGIEEFEMEKSGVRLRIRNSVCSPGQATAQVSGNVVPTLVEPPASVGQEPEEAQEDEGIHIFRAPIVGTYYITPKPDAAPFVQVGDRVTSVTVLCIIEAMKIFNQIECDVSGEIVEVLVENGQPVEYGEALFKIRLS